MKFTKLVTALALALSVTITGVNAATGVVGTDSLNIRSAPSTDSQVIGKEYTGSSVTIKEYANGWYTLDYNGVQAYASADYVSVHIMGEGCVTYTDSVVYLRNTPSWSSDLFEEVPYGTKLSVTGVEEEFYEILYNGNLRYIPVVCTDVRRDALVSRQESTRTLAQRSVDIAAQYVGTPYVYGGSSPSGFDCSGFTSFVYSQLGVTLPRTSYSQSFAGIPVQKSELMPGDLVFFNTSGGGISHVGIYSGNGMFIHSPIPGYSVCFSDMNSDYYLRTYVCARRVG